MRLASVLATTGQPYVNVYKSNGGWLFVKRMHEVFLLLFEFLNTNKQTNKTRKWVIAKFKAQSGWYGGAVFKVRGGGGGGGWGSERGKFGCSLFVAV